MKKIRLNKICLIFENCEIAYIPKEDIMFLEINIENDTMFYQSESDLFHCLPHCALNNLTINRSYLEQNHSLMGGTKNTDITLLDRIKNYKDIVSIELFFKGVKETKMYYLPWNDEDEYLNKYQKVKDLKSKNQLVISVKKGK